jgi:hypothetical protein
VRVPAGCRLIEIEELNDGSDYSGDTFDYADNDSMKNVFEDDHHRH